MRLVSYQSPEGPAWGVLLPAGVVPSARLGPDVPAALAELLAHNAPMQLPRTSSKPDFEAELAVVIGRTTRFVHDADVRDAVFGYACFNDGSLRDFQRKTSQWTIGKNFDATGAFGPWLVGADELPRTALDCTSRRS